MKVTLFVIGLSIAGIAFIIDLQDDMKAVSVGYFLLAGAMLISAAIWKTDLINNGYFKSMQKVYAALAEGPMDMDALVKKVVGQNIDPSEIEHYRAVIGRMLSKRQIIIKDSLVTIGEGIDTAV
jgi:hypothetical protein